VELDRRAWRQKAEDLRNELGAKFLDGTRVEQAAMVRDWIRNFREQKRLAPPEPADGWSSYEAMRHGSAR
jgi:hypothetical protein